MSSHTPKNSMLAACRAMLRPVVKMLLRSGVMWKEFAELGKNVYVDVAGTEYGIAGRPTNASRVSLITGLTRREVKKQRDLMGGSLTDQPVKTNNAMRLLAGWHKDPDFTDSSGQPRALGRDDEGLGFAALHRRYGGDIPAVAMLKELMGTGAVVETDNQRVIAVSRYYMPDPMDPEAVLRSGSVFRDFGTTIAFNLSRNSADASLFEGRATGVRIPANKMESYREFLETHGQAFLELVDDWLEKNQLDSKSVDSGREIARLGVGVYMIHDRYHDGGEQP
ncbi:MAG: DUF6502 family protein [Gammaproteobacteria bacterium]